MPTREFKNLSRGKHCDGVCDLCNNYSQFLFHGLGIFCKRCANNLSDNVMKKHKLVMRKDNIFLFEYCSVCHRREKVMYTINFGFCKDCMHKTGRKDTAMRKEEQTKDQQIARNLQRRFKPRV